MKRFGRALIVALGIAVLASVVSLVPQKNVTAQGGPTVTIGGPIPLPVAGTVGSQQSGAWNVGLASGAAVNINNQASAPVPTQTVAAGPLTHVGRLPSDHVTLFGDTNCPGPEVPPTTFGFDRVNSDGSITRCFALPSGQALVVTDVFWVAPNATPGNTVGLVVFAGGGIAAPGIGVLVSLGKVNADGSGGGSEHLTGGLVFTQAAPPTYAGAGTFLSGTPSSVSMQGYLMSFR